MVAQRPLLASLADRLGVQSGYHDIGGTWRPTSPRTQEALCGALGFDASSEAAAAGSLDALERAERERLVEPVRVWREHAGLAPPLLVRHPGARGDLPLRVTVEDESGERRECEMRLPWAPAGRRVRLAVPFGFASGHHALRLECHKPDGVVAGEQRLIVAPRTAWTVREALGGGRAAGVWSNLYTVRSRRNWGFGDLSDLAELARRCAAAGGDFVGLNPLHALPNRREVSPYSPTSREFRSPLYLDVESIPEFAEVRGAFDAAPIETLRAADAIDYDAVRTLKLDALRALHAHFADTRRDRPGKRADEYRDYLAREGGALVDFATFEALSDHFAARTEGGDWRRWPIDLRDPRHPAVARFRSQHAERVDFHCWLQFELDQQLAAAAAAGREAGLRIGLYHDLAVGSAPDSADVWARQDLYARDVYVGAPPDPFSAEGQDWQLPPPDPHRLRQAGYGPFVHLLRSALRHAGALRIDHVMGLERMFWIPAGRPASEGAYVRYPLDDLLGILALESRRHRCLVVGEDLGTVSPGLRGELASFGILSSAVLVFEREGDAFRPPAHWSPRALASANTHDLAPLRGYWSGRDLELRRRAGAFTSRADFEMAKADRDREREALLDRLGTAPGEVAWCRATTQFLSRTPAPLVAVSLDDVAEETEPVNLPGLSPDRHPSWRRRMRAPLEALPLDAALAPATLRGAPDDHGE